MTGDIFGAQPDGDGQEGSVCAKVRRPVTFDTIDEAIAAAERALADPLCEQDAALIYQPTVRDGLPVTISTKKQYIGRGYVPGRVKQGEIVLALTPMVSRSRAIAVHFMCHGYETCIRRAILRPRDIVVWDDIVLEPLTDRTAAMIVGRVSLEDGADTDGMVISVNGDDAAFVDDEGYFVVDLVSPGQLRIDTQKPGYLGAFAELTAKPGERVECELRGYRMRYARVRWVFQPDGSRDFTTGVASGEDWLSPRKLNRVSFGKGFIQVESHSDFHIQQVGDRLVLRHFDQSGRKQQGSLEYRLEGSDALSKAPDGPFKRGEHVLRSGMVLAICCYDGEHYAKLEVLDVTDRPPDSD